MTVRRRFSRALVCCVALAAWLAAAPADAIWPYTTTRASGDSLSGADWEERFGQWRNRPLDLLGTVSTTGTLADSLREALESRNINISPSELARMAAMARKQQQRQEAPPTSPGPPTRAAESPASAQDASRSEAVAVDPGAGAPAKADSVMTTQADDPFGAPDDNADGFFDDQSPADSLARDQGPLPSTPSPPNAAMISALAGRGVSPTFSSRFTSSNDRMNLNSSLATTIADYSGVTITSNLSYGNILSLTQNTETRNRALTNALLVPVPRYGLNFNVTTTNSRSDRDSRSIQNARTRNQIEDRGATVTGQGSRNLIAGLRANAFYARRFSQNEQLIEGSSSGTGDRASEVGGDSFGFGGDMTRFRWIRVRGRYGRATSSNLDRSASFVTDDNPAGEQESTSEGDSASVNVSVPGAGWFSNLTLDFQTQDTVESFSDVVRSSTGGVGSGTEFQLETKSIFSRALRIHGTVSPLSVLSADLAFGARRDSVAYAIRDNQFKDEQRVDWSINSTLTYKPGGSVRVTYEEEYRDVNQDEPSKNNPRNPQTRTEKSRDLNISVNHGFTQSLKFRVYGNIGLTQSFHEHLGPQGRGDRDDLRTRLGIDMDGRISSKATARVQMYVRTFDQAFIDSLRSSRSRNETEFVVRPSFVYNISNNLVLEQFYGLSSKVLDEIYNPSRNTLNRNHFLQTKMRYKMTSRLELEARWEYSLQDNGFYVDNLATPQEDRVYAPSARTKKDEIKLSMRYAIIKGGVLTFTSENVATREHNGVFKSVATQRGNLALGLDSRVRVGKLSLDTRASRNQSFNVALNRNVFYNVQSTLSYAF